MIRKIITAGTLLAAAWAAQAQNKVYMEQVGSGSTITILQDGSDNRIGTELAPIFIGGGSNTVDIQQIGSANELAMTVNGAATTVAVTVNGNNNVSTIDCGTNISAGCSSSDIIQTITGDTNTVTQNLGSGANHSSKLVVDGDTNTVTHNSTNSGASTVEYTVTGSNNTITMTQSGLLAKTIIATTAGSNNTVAITQSD
jgi:hypothetical protein